MSEITEEKEHVINPPEPEATKEPKPEKEKSSRKVEYDGYLAREEAASYLEAIAGGLRKGHIRLKQEERELLLELPDRVDVNVRAARKNSDQKIRMELSWTTPSEGDLTITSD